MGPPDTNEPARVLLTSLVDRVVAGRSVDGLLGSGIDAQELVATIEPVARAGAVIEWLAVNGDRVDAVLSGDDEQWRVVFGTRSGTTIDWLDLYQRPAEYAGIPGGRAVVVNGPSGSGKSTLLNALHAVAAMPLVLFDEPEHIGTVQPEYLIWRDRAPTLHQGYLQAIGALARGDNHVAVSAGGHRQAEFIEAFSGVPLVTVGLTCDLDVLNRRERRTGRWGGIAATSLGVHDGWTYDLQFDTTDEPDPKELAHQVLDRLDLEGTSTQDVR